jgi:hypothetical protein
MTRFRLSGDSLAPRPRVLRALALWIALQRQRVRTPRLVESLQSRQHVAPAQERVSALCTIRVQRRSAKQPLGFDPFAPRGGYAPADGQRVAAAGNPDRGALPRLCAALRRRQIPRGNLRNRAGASA